jgi:putative ABC transport system ATP-binding protein
VKEVPVPLLTARDLTKSFPGEAGRTEVLRGVSLSLDPSETLALTGESGSGKSTLLHLLAGLDRPDGGRIDFDGQDIAALDDRGRAGYRREVVGIVFQQFNLVPSLDVAGNLALQARLAGRHDPGWLGALAEQLGLAPQLKSYPEQLSGGQQQRVAIGRALAARPRLVLADEPTGNLDEATGDAVMAVMTDLVRDSGAALLMVTHSTRLAARLDRRLHLAQGRIAP